MHSLVSLRRCDNNLRLLWSIYTRTSGVSTIYPSENERKKITFLFWLDYPPWSWECVGGRCLRGSPRCSGVLDDGEMMFPRLHLHVLRGPNTCRTDRIDSDVWSSIWDCSCPCLIRLSVRIAAPSSLIRERSPKIVNVIETWIAAVASSSLNWNYTC